MIKRTRIADLLLVVLGILLIVFGYTEQSASLPLSTSVPLVGPPGGPGINHSFSILVDDFNPQPYQGESVYFYNRLGGDRGAINDSRQDWGIGQVTTTVSSGNTWGGGWMSLNHPLREGLSLNFSAILPVQILPFYQSRITGITVLVGRGKPGTIFRLELKDGDQLRWENQITLNGKRQELSASLPALGKINQLVWVLERASPGDYVVLDRIFFTAETQITETAEVAFVWSYAMLLNNWNPATGLVRDKATDASGEIDAIQATGSLAAATAIAEQLGVIEPADAIQIVDQISKTLLYHLPRYHGLWPHWVKASMRDGFSIVEQTEWSSADTVIAAVGLLEAESALGLDTSGVEQILRSIDWQSLVTQGGISHGYDYTGRLIPYTWDVFGGESWLVELAYAGATGQVTLLSYPTPPTANGSGFIDELAWLFLPSPSGQDYWGTDWVSYRLAAADNQVSYNLVPNPVPCFLQLGLFGLSAGEVPEPSTVPQDGIYQAFGIGGRFEPRNDGSALFGVPVALPHYSAMIASLRPEKAIKMWDWLIRIGDFTPLTNVESFMFPANTACNSNSIVWNQQKGSWNLSLQTLGWGRYLAERNGQVPILWQAALANPLIQKGYTLLAPPGGNSNMAPTPPPASQIALIANPNQIVSYDFEGDFQASGIVADRSVNGFDAQVHGQVNKTEGISGGQAILFSGNGYLQAQVNPAVGRTTVSFLCGLRAIIRPRITNLPAQPGGMATPVLAGSWHPISPSSGVMTPGAFIYQVL